MLNKNIVLLIPCYEEQTWLLDEETNLDYFQDDIMCGVTESFFHMRAKSSSVPNYRSGEVTMCACSGKLLER